MRNIRHSLWLKENTMLQKKNNIKKTSNPEADTSNPPRNAEDEASTSREVTSTSPASNIGKKTNITSSATNTPGYASEQVPYTTCLQCQTPVISDDNAMKCFHCASFLHQECGTTYKPLEEHDADKTNVCCCKECASAESITLCTNCAVQLKANSHRLRVKPTNDFNLGVSFSQKPVRKRGNETHLRTTKP